MSDENLKTFKELEKFDVSQDNFCESDGRYITHLCTIILLFINLYKYFLLNKR